MKTKFCLLAVAVLSIMMPREVGATGACTAARFHDWQDMGCNQNFAGAGGVPKATCPDCPGMPRWWVSEPYASLCMADTPLSYTMSSGQEMAFQFFYHQRSGLPEADETPITNLTYEIQVHGALPVYATGANCGTDAYWGNTWNMSVVIMARGHYATPVFSQGYYALVFHPEGGIDNYTNLNYTNIVCQNPQTKAILTDVSGLNYPKVSESGSAFTNIPAADTNGIYWGDAGVGVKLVYPDGSQDVFGLSAYVTPVVTVYQQPATTNPVVRLLLTRRIDPQGRVTQLGYEQFSSIAYTHSVYRVKYVVDPDSRTNVFKYTSPTNSQLAEIDDPYGRKTTLAYNGDATLSQIIDAAGLTNSFSYQASQVLTVVTNFCPDSNGYDRPCASYQVTSASSGWLNGLTTPYGTSQFSYYEVDDASVTDGSVQRALYASEPAGAQQLYYYYHNADTNVLANDTAPIVPGQTNFDDGIAGGLSGYGHNSLIYRNSFHWGRRQFTAMNSSAQGNLAASLTTNPTLSASYFSSALAQLTATDFAVADLKHWLLAGSDQLSITEGLSSERAPSQDTAGLIPGARTWYNYASKPVGGAENLGSNPQIACIAKVLPDGTSQYTTYNYYQLLNPFGGVGLVSDSESSYTKPDGTLGALTNWYGYAGNAIDLTSISNSAGRYVNYGYNTNHLLTAITNALQQTTALSWDVNKHLESDRRATAQRQEHHLELLLFRVFDGQHAPADHRPAGRPDEHDQQLQRRSANQHHGRTKHDGEQDLGRVESPDQHHLPGHHLHLKPL